MKDRIVCIVGASGSGKTTIAKELEKLGYNIIHSYTTREPREEYEWGHIFIDEEVQIVNFHDAYTNTDSDWIKVIKENGSYECENPIALKKIYNDYYWATENQYKNKGISIYVVCPDGARQVKESVEDAEVITIYIQCDEVTRRERMIDDGRDLQSIQNRIEKDREVFRLCKCDYVVDGNRGLGEVLKDVVEIIENR